MKTFIDWNQVHYLARISLAALLTGAVGLNRELNDHDAGMRTIMLVGVGSAVFTVLSLYAFAGITTVNDPARVAAQIVVGIGFLGAGALIRQGERVKNLTTAATIWVAAAIGMAAGVGWYTFAIGTTTLTLIILTLLHRIERHLPFTETRGTPKPLHPQPNLSTSARMGWLEDAPEKTYEADTEPPDKSAS